MTDNTNTKTVVNFAVLPEDRGDAILEGLTKHDELAELEWNMTDPRSSAIIFVQMDSAQVLQELRPIREFSLEGEELREKIINVLGSDVPVPDRVLFSTNDDPLSIFWSLIKNKKISLPIRRCVTDLKDMIAQRAQDTQRLLDSTPKTMETSFYGETQLKTPIRASVQFHHPKTIEKFGLKDLLDRRSRNRLQRKRTGYTPLAPVADMTDSVYADSVRPLTDHIDLAYKEAKKLDDLDTDPISPSSTNMQFTQINVGMPFFGSMVRENLKLSEPTDELLEDIRLVSDIHLRGLASKYNELGEESFTQLTTRATVPVYSYQGPATNSASHLMNQTMWQAMLSSGDGLFAFEDYVLPTVVGYRLQDSKGKIRPSYVIDVKGGLQLSQVVDGDDPLLKVTPELASTAGEVGARVRHVSNPNHCQNHALVAAASYLSDWKSYEYKLAFTVTYGTLMTLVPGSKEFEDMWREAWTNLPFVSEFAAKRGLKSFDSMLDKMIELGEFPWVGDIGNFDGSLIWKIVSKSKSNMFTDRVVDLSSRIWDAPILGVFNGANDEPGYYTIDTRDEATRVLKDSLGSGMGTTSVDGRTAVPGTCGHALRNSFDVSKELYYSYPTSKGVSFFSLHQRNAGDDHALGMLLFWLVTGIHPKECKALLAAEFKRLNVFKIDPEDPPMCAGYRAHLSPSDGRLEDWTLSSGRLYSNNVFPEDTKKALGLKGSIDAYIASAEGSVAENDMDRVTDSILKIYNFDSYEDLIDAANEDQYYIDNEIGNFSISMQIASALGLKESDLFHKYTFDELLELGADEELLENWRQPIPQNLTRNPFTFFNEETVKRIASDLESLNYTESDTGFHFDNIPPLK
jgi:hypothetical protein